MDSADRDDVHPQDEQAQSAARLSWIANAFLGLAVSVTLIALILPQINFRRGIPAVRSEHDDKVARQQLVDQQIADFEAALDADARAK